MWAYKVLQEKRRKKWVDKYGQVSPARITFPIATILATGVLLDIKKHLGHDLMGSVGTPVIAIESSGWRVLGWNMYGGWRIGIRSFDKDITTMPSSKDHLSFSLAGACVTQKGDVIGYLGMVAGERKM